MGMEGAILLQEKKEEEEEEKLRQKRKECTHFTVRRIINKWYCLECNLQFRPISEKERK